MDATALDHTPPQPPDSRAFREQFGPGREAKALAIVQIAVFDAVNAATGNRFRSYTGLPGVTRPAGLNVAIAQPPTTRSWRSGPRRRQPSIRCSRKTSTNSPTET